MESVLSLPGPAGELRGIMNLPAEARDTGVVFLHGWGTYRIGPHRVLVEAARHIGAGGFPSLRFDLPGRGESAGDAAAIRLPDMIACVPPVVAAFREQAGVRRVVLLGLCSGGEVAVGAATASGAAGVVLWSTPMLGRQFDVATEARRSAREAGGYLKKAFRLETWRKLVSGRLHWRTIGRVLFGGWGNKPGAVTDELARLREFSRFTGPVQLIYAGADPEAPAAQSAYRVFLGQHGIPHEVHQVDGANHNFYALAWKAQLLGHLSDFLQRHFGHD